MSYSDFLAVISLFSDPFFFFILFVILSFLYFHFDAKQDKVKADSRSILMLEPDLLDESIKKNCFDGDAQKMKEFYDPK